MLFGRRLRSLIAVFVTAVVACNVYAQRSIEQVGGFTRTVWTIRDGVPEHIRAIAQTPDGWLWITAGSHLYRFDGVTAEQIDFLGGDATTIVAIFSASSGDLWLAFQSGRTVRLPAGDFHHFEVVAGDIGNPWTFAEDKQGTIWLVTTDGLY